LVLPGSAFAQRELHWRRLEVAAHLDAGGTPVWSGTVNIDGVDWTIYDNRKTDADVGNARYALTTESGGSTFVLLGTATPEEFATFATAITPTIEAQD
jgi:hypothetical protein